MAPIGTLWGIPIQRQTKVILSAAAIAGLEVNTPTVEFHVTNQSPEFLAKFPMGKIPAFEGADGLRLFEGAAIARYVCSLAPESGLLGKNSGEAALVDQWIHLAETEIAMFSYEIMGYLAGYLGPYNEKWHETNLQRQGRALKCLDAHLGSSTSGYLVSDHVTLADLVIAAASEQAAKITCGTAERAQYPHVFAHYDRVTADPKVKKVFGEPGFVEEAMAYQGNKE